MPLPHRVNTSPFHGATETSRRLIYSIVALVIALSACEDPSADEFIRRAEGYREKGDISASIIELKNALQKQPRNAHARYLLGQNYLDIRDMAGAQKELLRAREYGTPPEKLAEPLAKLWLTQRQFEKVLAQLRVDDTASAASKATVAIAHGRARRALGDLEGAKRDFEAALEHDPGRPVALVGLARVVMQMGDRLAVESAVARAFEVAPGDLNVLALKGDHDFGRGDYASAQSHYQTVLKARPDSIAVRLALARIQIYLGKFDQAITHLVTVLARAKAHPDASYLRASLALESGDYAAARLHSKQVLLTNPNHAPSLLIAGVASYVLGQLEQADRYLSGVLADDPSHNLARRLHAATRARRQRARADGPALTALLDDSVDPRQLVTTADPKAREHGDLEAARAYFAGLPAEFTDAILAHHQPPTAKHDEERARLRSALEETPRDVRTLARLANLESQAGNVRDAASLLEKAIAADPYAVISRALLGQLHLREARPAKALEVAKVALRDHPEHLVLLGLVGQAQLRGGQTQEAKLTFRSLVDLQPESAPAHYLLALAYRDQGDAALFKNRLDRVLALDPDHLLARVAMARLMAEEGNFAAARDLADEVLESAPDDPRALDLSGAVALVQGRAADAVALLRRAAGEEPTTTAVLKLAYAQQRAGNGAGSRATLERRLAESPEDANARLVLANKYLSAGALEDARSHYAKIILLSPNNVVALNNLAWVNLRLGHSEAALGQVERAYQLAAHDARVVDTFGLAQLRVGNADEAVRMLRRAHKMAPDSLQIQTHLAHALAENGEEAEAREVLQRILSGNAGFPEQTDAEALLRELGG